MKVLLAVIGLAMTGTWLANVLSYSSVAYLGQNPDYLGYWAWGLMPVVGLALSAGFRRQLFSTQGVLLAGAVIIISLIFGSYYIWHGLALGGILSRPLSLAIYANLVIILCLNKLQTKDLRRSVHAYASVLLVLSVATVIFSQTKLGSLLAAGILLTWIFYGAKPDNKLKIFSLLLFTSVILASSLFSNYFAMFRNQSVHDGLAYDYKLFSTVKITGSALLYGHGPASLPQYINNQNYVPADVIKSLGLTTRFSANHNLLYDFNYYFGVLAALALVAINVLGVRAYLKNRASFEVGYLLIFVCLLANALFNAPSLVLTSLYFTALFGLFWQPPRKNSHEKH